MDVIRLISLCEQPFNLSRLIYVHCNDLGTKKFITVTSFPCLEIYCVLGHLNFPRVLAVCHLCCVLRSDDCKGKLSTTRSPVLINAKSSCYFTVTIFLVVFVSYLCRDGCISRVLMFSRRLGKPGKVSLNLLLLSSG